MIYAVILAGGKGTRMNSNNINKVALKIDGKPLIVYAVEKVTEFADKVIVVIGAYADSVKQCLTNFQVEYAYQDQQLGTADAVARALNLIKNSSDNLVLIGYGDHMMHYKNNTIKQLIDYHKTRDADLTLVSVFFDDPNLLAWGRVIKNKQGKIIAIVEQKDATEEELKIKELNAGFYVVRASFLKKFLPQITPSPATGEYYLTDLVKLAVENGYKVENYTVDFAEVGYGVNTPQQLKLTEQMLIKSKQDSN